MSKCSVDLFDPLGRKGLVLNAISTFRSRLCNLGRNGTKSLCMLLRICYCNVYCRTITISVPITITISVITNSDELLLFLERTNCRTELHTELQEIFIH